MLTASEVRRSVHGPSRAPKIILNFRSHLRSTDFCDYHDKTNRKPATMSDVEMEGGVALGVTSPTQSQLADEINGGAMDVKSVADSTVSSRL